MNGSGLLLGEATLVGSQRIARGSDPRRRPLVSALRSTRMLGFAALAALVTAAATLLVVLVFGSVTGEEFSPGSFDRRQFSYLEIPLLRLQVSPVRRELRTGPLESYLAANNLIPPADAASRSRWDLVAVLRGLASDDPGGTGWGDAQILCQYLDSVDSQGTNVWLDWTQRNPSLASVLWPMVAKIARHGLYMMVPDMLAAAQRCRTGTELQQSLDRLVSKRCLELANWMQALGQHDRAVELFTSALDHAPRSSSALRGRAASLHRLGKADLAAADLARAQRIEQPD